MRGGRKLQPATDHGAVQDGDDGHATVLDPVERAVPGLRNQNPAQWAGILEIGKISAGRKMLALAVHDDDACLVGRFGEEGLDAGDRRIVQGISFGRARQT